MSALDGPRFGPREGDAPRSLVLLVHGYGADGNDLIDLAHWWAEAVPDALFIAPHAPQPCDGVPFGRQWFPLWDRSAGQLAAGVAGAAEALGGFVGAEAARLGLTPERVVLMGFSQGAMTVLETGLCGGFGPPGAILAYAGALIGAEGIAGRLAGRPPVLLVHGEDDEVVPPARSREAEAALAAAGVPVRALFRPGLGHGLDDVGLAAGAEMLRGVLGPT